MTNHSIVARRPNFNRPIIPLTALCEYYLRLGRVAGALLLDKTIQSGYLVMRVCDNFASMLACDCRRFSLQ